MGWLDRLLRKIRDAWEQKPVPKPKPDPNPPPPPPGDEAAELLVEHNIERRMRSLRSFGNSATLIDVALRHSQFQAAADRLTHIGQGGSSVWGRLQDAGYQFAAASENAAFGQTDPDQVVADWMGSGGHRNNILGPYIEIGGASARSPRSGRLYWTCIYATPGTQRQMFEAVTAMLPTEPIQTPHGQVL